MLAEPAVSRNSTASVELFFEIFEGELKRLEEGYLEYLATL